MAPQVWHSCQQLEEAGGSKVVLEAVYWGMHADPMLRSGHIFTFPVSTLSPKLLHNCLGVLVLFWRHQRLKSCEVALTCVTEFGDWEAGQAGLEVESRHLAVLNVALLTVTRSYSGSRAGRWTDRYKNSAAILLRLHQGSR